MGTAKTCIARARRRAALVRQALHGAIRLDELGAERLTADLPAILETVEALEGDLAILEAESVLR